MDEVELSDEGSGGLITLSARFFTRAGDLLVGKIARPRTEQPATTAKSPGHPTARQVLPVATPPGTLASNGVTNSHNQSAPTHRSP
jgi:hypothetical protein